MCDLIQILWDVWNILHTDAFIRPPGGIVVEAELHPNQLEEILSQYYVVRPNKCLQYVGCYSLY